MSLLNPRRPGGDDRPPHPDDVPMAEQILPELEEIDAQLRRTTARRQKYLELEDMGSYRIETAVMDRLLSDRFRVSPVVRSS